MPVAYGSSPVCCARCRRQGCGRSSPLPAITRHPVHTNPGFAARWRPRTASPAPRSARPPRSRSAAPDWKPNNAMAVATASSKKLLAPIRADGPCHAPGHLCAAVEHVSQAGIEIDLDQDRHGQQQDHQGLGDDLLALQAKQQNQRCQLALHRRARHRGAALAPGAAQSWAGRPGADARHPRPGVAGGAARPRGPVWNVPNSADAPSCSAAYMYAVSGCSPDSVACKAYTVCFDFAST